jgi:hypothetical protein
LADGGWIWANASWATADGLRGHFDEAMVAAAATSRTAPPGRMRFQNHAIAVEDLLAMFAVEFVTCHLDFLVAVPDRPGHDLAIGLKARAAGVSRWMLPIWQSATPTHPSTRPLAGPDAICVVPLHRHDLRARFRLHRSLALP